MQMGKIEFTPNDDGTLDTIGLRAQVEQLQARVEALEGRFITLSNNDFDNFLKEEERNGKETD